MVGSACFGKFECFSRPPFETCEACDLYETREICDPRDFCVTCCDLRDGRETCEACDLCDLRETCDARDLSETTE